MSFCCTQSLFAKFCLDNALGNYHLFTNCAPINKWSVRTFFISTTVNVTSGLIMQIFIDRVFFKNKTQSHTNTCEIQDKGATFKKTCCDDFFKNLKRDLIIRVVTQIFKKNFGLNAFIKNVFVNFLGKCVFSLHFLPLIHFVLKKSDFKRIDKDENLKTNLLKINLITLIFYNLISIGLARKGIGMQSASFNYLKILVTIWNACAYLMKIKGLKITDYPTEDLRNLFKDKKPGESDELLQQKFLRSNAEWFMGNALTIKNTLFS